MNLTSAFKTPHASLSIPNIYSFIQPNICGVIAVNVLTISLMAPVRPISAGCPLILMQQIFARINADTAPDTSHRATVRHGAAFLVDEKLCCISHFPFISDNKHLTRSDLRWEDFLSAYSWRWHSPSLLESRQQEQVVAGDRALSQAAKTDECCWLLSLTVSS